MIQLVDLLWISVKLFPHLLIPLLESTGFMLLKNGYMLAIVRNNLFESNENLDFGLEFCIMLVGSIDLGISCQFILLAINCKYYSAVNCEVEFLQVNYMLIGES